MNNIISFTNTGNQSFLDLNLYIDYIISIIIDDIDIVKNDLIINDDEELVLINASEKNNDLIRKTYQKKISICIGFSKYEAVRRVAQQLDFEEVGEKDNWNIYWTDGFISFDKMFHLKEYQKINHFPGMIEICRKDSLARNVNRLLKLFPEEFEIIPRTWCLSSDIIDFQSYCRKNRMKNFILKPEASCQGKGIVITQNVKDLKSTDGMVCQVYINHPFLMDEYKFDLRIYVLVTSIEPLRIYAYNEGLVRFTTVKYEEPNQRNINNVFMHLTNYTVQKESSNFIKDNEYMGTKRRFSVFNQWFVKHGYDIKKIWNDIDDVIIKTLISIHYTLCHNYRSAFPNHSAVSACFEILGFDIILDDLLQPLLIEVNHSPSFHTDSQLDTDVKESLLFDTFNLLNLHAIKESLFYEEHSRVVKKRLYATKGKSMSKKDDFENLINLKQKIFDLEVANIGNFRIIFPSPTSGSYDKFIQNSISLFNETVSYRARLKCMDKMKDNIQKKARKIDVVKPEHIEIVKPGMENFMKMPLEVDQVEIKILEKESSRNLSCKEVLEIISYCIETYLDKKRSDRDHKKIQNILACLDKFFLDETYYTSQFISIENIINHEKNKYTDDDVLGCLCVAKTVFCENNIQNLLTTTYTYISWND